jgi:predicted HicB family RNase H-like nuclease
MKNEIEKPRITISARVRPNLHRALATLARKSGRTFSRYVEHILAEHAKRAA